MLTCLTTTCIDRFTYLVGNYRKRVSRIPGYIAKKTWYEINTELTRYTNSIRESMIR